MAEAAKKKKVFDGRYEVLSIVGRGAASVVYHARHVGALTSEVALKVLVKQVSTDGKSSNSDLLRKEALAMVSARHKYVVRLDDFHSVGDLCYLAMEFASLGDARKYVGARGGKLSVEVGELFLSQTAEALDFVHRVGIVHRDIKPDNILVISEKEIRLADFGVAVLPGESASMKDLQAGVGTMSYMAPEVIEGIAYDKRSDIYSLGVAFYELFSGIHPFEKAPLIKQLEVREDKNVPPLNIIAPDVPQYISNVVMQAMSYDPARRFSSCQDLIQSLLVNKSQSGKSPVPVQPAPVANAPEPGKRSVTARSSPDAPSEQTVQAAPREIPARILDAVPTSAKPAPQVIPEPFDLPSDDVAPVASPPPEGAGSFVSPPDAEIQREPAPAQPNKPPPRSQPSTLAPSTHPTQDSRKPKRSLEDLRKLARETKTSAVSTESVKAESKSKAKKPLRPTVAVATSRSRSLSSFFLLVIAVALVYILYGYFFSGSRNEEIPESPIQTSSPSPSVEPKTLSFPDLPSGIYHGSVKGLLVNEELPLSLISLGAERGVIVIVGLQGWTPQLTVPQAGTDTLRVASNGVILELSGQPGKDDVTGQVLNKVTGEKGTWSVERTR